MRRCVAYDGAGTRLRRHVYDPGTDVRIAMIDEIAGKRSCYDGHHQLQRHLGAFINACNDGRRLKTLKVLAPCTDVSEYGHMGPNASASNGSNVSILCGVNRSGGSVRAQGSELQMLRHADLRPARLASAVH